MRVSNCMKDCIVDFFFLFLAQTRPWASCTVRLEATPFSMAQGTVTQPAAAPDFPPSSLSPEVKTCQRASMQTLCVIIEQGNRKWGSLRSAGRAVFKRFENVAFAQWCCRPPFLCSLGAIHSHFLCKSSTERPREDIMKTLSCSLWNVAVAFLSAETGSLFQPEFLPPLYPLADCSPPCFASKYLVLGLPQGLWSLSFL